MLVVVVYLGIGFALALLLLLVSLEGETSMKKEVYRKFKSDMEYAGKQFPVWLAFILLGFTFAWPLMIGYNQYLAWRRNNG